MSVPYTFANTPNGTKIPLSHLDADFTYIDNQTSTLVANLPIKVVNTIADLRAFSVNATLNVEVNGYYTNGDGGGGYFYPVAGAAPGTYVDNGGTIIVPTGGDGSSAWIRVYSGPINVKWFGARGDGITDDTTAITNAIATGKQIFFPSGTFISGPQIITTARQKIFGIGWESIIQASTASSNLFTVRAYYVQFSDLRLNGAATDATTTSYAIFTAQANPARYLTINNIYVTGSQSNKGFNNAFKFDASCHYGTVSNCLIEQLWGNTSSHGYGVLIGEAYNCQVIGNRYFGDSGRGRHGVYLSSGAADCLVGGNYIYFSDYEGITMYSYGVEPPCARNVISNNFIFGCCAANNSSSGAIGIYASCNNIIIQGNEITGSGAKGIAIDGTGVVDLSDICILNNIVRYSSLIGIDIISCTRGELSNNLIFESGTASAGVSPNIRLVSDGVTATRNFVITGNNSSGPSYSKSAFQLNSTAPSPAYLTVYGNQFQQCVTYSVELNSVPCAIDGRIQYTATSVSYGSISNGSSYTATYTINGTAAGDIITADHTSLPSGFIISGIASGSNTVKIVVANLSGGSSAISSGTLYVDVWKRQPSSI